ALARAIPMRPIAWDERQPGHFEVDLVHQSGPSASGEYVHTLQTCTCGVGRCDRRGHRLERARGGPGPQLFGHTHLTVMQVWRMVSPIARPACRLPCWNSTPMTAVSFSTT
ncbi:MAG: hypothetical protein ABI847_15610, partial [Anaerolineales bacterium]